MSVGIVQFELLGWLGAPGTNTLAFTRGSSPLQDWDDAAAQLTSEMRTVYQALAQYTPQGWSARATGIVRVVDEATGELQEVAAYEPPEAVTSPVTAAEGRNSRATQLGITYDTDVVHRGRLIRGRQFLGPIIPAAFANDVTVVGTLRTAVVAAYGGMISGLGVRLAVWSRPVPPQGGIGPSAPGAYGDVQLVRASLLPAVLRSRRDS